VKLWSLQNQQLASTVSQFHSFVFEVLIFGEVFCFSRGKSSESLTANGKQQKAAFAFDYFCELLRFALCESS